MLINILESTVMVPEGYNFVIQVACQYVMECFRLNMALITPYSHVWYFKGVLLTQQWGENAICFEVLPVLSEFNFQ